MQIISCEKTENCTKKADVNFVDFSILGFKRSEDKKKLDIYYLFVSEIKEFHLIRESFLLNENNIDDEMAYLNHPIHDTINIDKYTLFKKDSIRKIMEKCNAINSYYCEFEAINIINRDVVICEGIQFTLNNIQQITNFIIPLHIYMRIQIIKNSIIFKIPIDASIDNNSLYDNIKIIDVSEIKYLGSEFYNGEGFINYYSLKQKNNSIGICLPVVNNKKIIFKKNITLKQFNSLYKETFQVNRRNMIILDWAKDKSQIKLLCLIYRTNNNPIKYYLLKGEIQDSIILNPYLCI